MKKETDGNQAATEVSAAAMGAQRQDRDVQSLPLSVQPQQAKEIEARREERGWLIEWYRFSTGADKQPSWWTGHPFGGTQGFSEDANKAVRFARKQDAEKFIPLIAKASASNIDWDCRATEHIWMAPTPPLSCDEGSVTPERMTNDDYRAGVQAAVDAIMARAEHENHICQPGMWFAAGWVRKQLLDPVGSAPDSSNSLVVCIRAENEFARQVGYHGTPATQRSEPSDTELSAKETPSPSLTPGGRDADQAATDTEAGIREAVMRAAHTEWKRERGEAIWSQQGAAAVAAAVAALRYVRHAINMGCGSMEQDPLRVIDGRLSDLGYHEDPPLSEAGRSAQSASVKEDPLDRPSDSPATPADEEILHAQEILCEAIQRRFAELIPHHLEHYACKLATQTLRRTIDQLMAHSQPDSRKVETP